MTHQAPVSVLVTGGAGFIGCALSQALAPATQRWVVIDSLHPQVHSQRCRPSALHESAELVVGDVTDPLAWDALLARVVPDVIVHLAAETGTAQSLHESTRHGRVNVVGTTEMLDALAKAGVVPRAFLLASSRAVYGEGQWRDDRGVAFSPGQRSHAQLARSQWDFPHAKPMRNSARDTWPQPTSVYGSTKLAQEHIVAAWASSHDTALSVLRLQNVYGPGQSLTNSYTGIVALFSQWAAAGRSIPLYEDGLITRDFVYIDDVVAAFGALMSEAPNPGTRRYDVGSGVSTTIRDLAELLAEFHGAPAPHVTAEFRDGDVRFAGCDITPTVEALGWEPRWSVRDGIGMLQQWIASKR